MPKGASRVGVVPGRPPSAMGWSQWLVSSRRRSARRRSDRPSRPSSYWSARRSASPGRPPMGTAWWAPARARYRRNHPAPRSASASHRRSGLRPPRRPDPLRPAPTMRPLPSALHWSDAGGGGSRRPRRDRRLRRAPPTGCGVRQLSVWKSNQPWVPTAVGVP